MKRAKNRPKPRKRTSSLEQPSVLIASRVDFLTQLSAQFQRSLTDDQRMMLSVLVSTRNTDVNKILTKLAGLVTVEVLESVERSSEESTAGR